jgi:RNA polymerase sigma-70 factor (ECF subfamily)
MSITYTTGRLCAAIASTDASDASDAALIQSIAAGEKNAMRILFARHNVRIYRFLLRFIADRSIAEDLVSEVFLDVWCQAAKFRGRSQVGTWLLAIARNKALSAVRRRSPEELDEDAAERIEDPGKDPEASMENRQKADVLANCLSRLSAAHREVIDLVYYHEKSIDEVAAIMGVPQNTVKTRMFYARKHIAELLAAQGIDSATI